MTALMVGKHAQTRMSSRCVRMRIACFGSSACSDIKRVCCKLSSSLMQVDGQDSLYTILFQQLVASLQISSCVESDFHLVLVQLDELNLIASLLLRGARSPRDRLVASLNCNKSCGVSGCVDVLKASKTM